MSEQVDKLAEAPRPSVLAGVAARAESPEGARTSPRGFMGWPHLWVLMVSLAAVAAMISTTVTGQSGFYTWSIGIAIVLVAAWYDSATHRIPNALTYPAILLGLALNAATALAIARHIDVLARWLGDASLSPLQESAIGFAACAAIGVVSMLLGGIHGGDMKLIAAMGAIFGLHTVCSMLLWALLVVVPLAIVNLLIDRKLTQFFHFAGLQLMNWIWLKRNEPVLEVSSQRIPIAVPLAAGAILALAVPQGVLPVWLMGGA